MHQTLVCNWRQSGCRDERDEERRREGGASRAAVHRDARKSGLCQNKGGGGRERRKRCSFITSSWGKCREVKLGLFESCTLWLPVPKPSEDHHPPAGTTASLGSTLQAWTSFQHLRELLGYLPHTWTTKDLMGRRLEMNNCVFRLTLTG